MAIVAVYSILNSVKDSGQHPVHKDAKIILGGVHELNKSMVLHKVNGYNQ